MAEPSKSQPELNAADLKEVPFGYLPKEFPSAFYMMGKGYTPYADNAGVITPDQLQQGTFHPDNQMPPVYHAGRYSIYTPLAADPIGRMIEALERR